MEHTIHIIVYVDNTIVQVGNDIHCCIYITKDLYVYMFLIPCFTIMAHFVYF